MTNKRIFYASRSYDIVIYDRNLNAPCHEEMINGHQLVEVMNYLNGKISNQRILHSSGSDKMETTPINNIQIQNLFRRRLNG